MPQIFDNIEQQLLPALRTALELAHSSDFSVGYFNLRGWKAIDDLIERWPGGKDNQCRLLVGMQRLPQEELRANLRVTPDEEQLDNQQVLRLKRRLAEEFRAQLTLGIPTNADEAGLRRLAGQLRSGKVAVRLFLRYPLHAKLYLLFRSDPINPIIGYLGSSNLTLSGLARQGELNVDVMDLDAARKLSKWFEDRWNDHWCVDITRELIQVLEESWAREDTIPPYHIYVKMAYHLSQEARAGLSEFRIPRDFGRRLFDFQVAAVKIAAHHLNKRGGVLIGDVVGLGKTLMATALARIFQDDHGLETLIICPKNLVPMWEDYFSEYRLVGRILSLTKVCQELPELRRYRVVLIDESHNLRNSQGKRFLAIQEYLRENESKCILLSATPYNKTYQDLASQLRLFVPEGLNLGIRPERLLRELGEDQFLSRHQCPVHSLAAFEKSEFADDWRDLMRLYMVRRTRSFIQDNYATTDPDNGRKYLTFEDGTRSYFPQRIPRTVKIKAEVSDPNDQYARLYSDSVVATINTLALPRYGLGNYIAPSPQEPPTPSEAKQLQGLSRAGRRLMGFCRTNLFKRLESNGHTFLLSIERHILRNYVFLHAIEQGQRLPLGPQNAGMLDLASFDEDVDDQIAGIDLFEDDDEQPESVTRTTSLRSAADFKARAAAVYATYETQFKRRFVWVQPQLFIPDLAHDLASDSANLLSVLEACGTWDSAHDAKLEALHNLVAQRHSQEKVIVFSQFADTVRYLETGLRARGVQALAGVTGQDENPTSLAWRFSPVSNGKREQVAATDELRVLLATDVLSEGQNLQDGAIIVNFDLPWAIIRLVQRAGRVDRIGQQAQQILCYSFLPADGVETLIRLRARVRQRLNENAEVVGTDEAFFEDERERENLQDLYSEKAGIMDGEGDAEVDLASYAYQIWKNAVDRRPELQKLIPALPPVVFSTKPHQERAGQPEGALVYLRTGEGNDALAWVDTVGKAVTESQIEILRAAKCEPDTPALLRHEHHHKLVAKGVTQLLSEERNVGGQLGRPSGARFRTYERLKHHAERVKGTLFDTPDLHKAIEDIYRCPLRVTATDTINRQLRAGITDDKLAELVIALREEDRLCLTHEEGQGQEPQIICSLGLVAINSTDSIVGEQA